MILLWSSTLRGRLQRHAGALAICAMAAATSAPLRSWVGIWLTASATQYNRLFNVRVGGGHGRPVSLIYLLITL